MKWRTARWVFLILSVLVAVPLLVPNRVLHFPLSSCTQIAVRSRMIEIATCEYPIKLMGGPRRCLWGVTIADQPLQLTLCAATRSEYWPEIADSPAEILPDAPGKQSIRLNLRVCTIPLIPLFVLLTGTTAALWRLAWRCRVPLPGHCPRCGYNLTGNTSGVCPECGMSARPKLRG
ncbi:MAG: hypothetical protein HZB38_06720 [Planctomycetes bacterium]|nr:hypothetical protein [Planctomycetota bacterium]